MLETAARKKARRTCGSSLRLAIGMALAAWFATAGATAEAAQLVDVRVGRHPEFVRVVFETDAPATFSIESGGAPGEILVRLDAELASLVASRAGTDESGADVLLESLPGRATLARIRATVPVRVESQVLDEPPRVVLDLRSAGETPELPLQPTPELATPAEASPPPEAPPDAEPDAAREEADADPGDRVAGLLAKLPADLAPIERPEPRDPPAPPDPPAPAVAPAPPDPPAPAVAPPPPVSGAPPAAIASRFDERSLVIGGISGLVLGVGLSLLGRRGPGRGERRRPSQPQPERAGGVARAARRLEAPAQGELAEIPSERHPVSAPEPARAAASDEIVGRASTGARIEEDALVTDLLQMIQGLDDRSARGGELVAGLQERVERLDRRTRAQAEELAAQRQALARLQRALGHPPVRLAPDRSLRPRES